jgi:hypothetical protein
MRRGVCCSAAQQPPATGWCEVISRPSFSPVHGQSYVKCVLFPAKKWPPTALFNPEIPLLSTPRTVRPHHFGGRMNQIRLLQDMAGPSKSIKDEARTLQPAAISIFTEHVKKSKQCKYRHFFGQVHPVLI